MHKLMLMGIVVVAGTGCSVETDPPTKAELERDLVLEVEMSPTSIQPGGAINLKMALVNQSKTKSYPVVEPGGGSSAGWREPHVFFTAERQTADGEWEDVPKVTNLGRCGVYDADWRKDATKLGPGEALEIESWVASPSPYYEFQKPGPHRVTLHYHYRGGFGGKSEPRFPQFLDTMNDVPAFEIVSKPVTFDVVRPLDVVVKVKSGLKSKTKTRLSDLISVDLVNQSDEAVEVRSPALSAGAKLRLKIEGKSAGWNPKLTEQRSPSGVKRTLQPNESVALLGPGEFPNDIDGEWEYPKEDVVKLRAEYYDSTRKPRSVIKSDWVQIEVE